MSTTWIEAIAQHVDANSVTLIGSGQASQNLFIGRMPETPDLAMCLYEFGGGTPMQSMGSGTRIDMPRLQIICRGARDDYGTPRDLLTTTRTLLDLVQNQTLYTVAFLRIQPAGSVFSMGPDESERPRVAANFQVVT